MADKSARPYLICYDIACPRRLGRLHRHLKKIATPLQYSVFEAELTAVALNRLLHEMCDLINAREDDVRVYPIQRTVPMITLGPGYLPAGVLRFSETQAQRRDGNISNPPQPPSAQSQFPHRLHSSSPRKRS
jgi:CRISPR-associated protein Cas2